MNIITKDIKTIKDLRKYVNSIDWYNKEWSEKDAKEINEQQHHNIIVQSDRDNEEHIETWKIGEVFFNSSISKKLQKKTYKLPFATERVDFSNWRRSDVRDRLDLNVYNKYKDNDQSLRCFQLKQKQSYSSDLIISKAFIYANEYTDEIVCVSYGRKDIFWTKFFRDCLDASIPNNFDELERVKKWNLVLRKEEFKAVLTEGKTFDEALENFYKNNPDYNKENDSEYKRLPNTWNLWGTTSLDKLPENTNLKSAKNITDSYFFYGTDPAELGNIRER